MTIYINYEWNYENIILKRKRCLPISPRIKMS